MVFSEQSGIDPGFYLLGCGDAVMTVENGVGVGAAVVGEGTGVATVTGASVTPDCTTELVPVSQGSESISAISMKAAASADRNFRQQSLRAAWSESCARNRASEQCAGVSFTWLQQNNQDQNNASQNK